MRKKVLISVIAVTIIICLILLTVFLLLQRKDDVTPELNSKYTVTFYSDDEVVDTLETAGKEELELLLPEKSGHNFLGWYISDQKIDKDWFLNDYLQEDVEIVARWEVKNYKLIYDTNSGSDIDAIDLDFGSALVEPTAPTMEGLSFGGWYFDNETFADVVDFDNDVIGASNVTIFAKWNINQYRLNYNTNGGSDIDAVDIDFGSALVEPTVPTMEGFSFGGWYFDNETFVNVVDFSNDVIGASNITIFAKWNINQYRLNYNTNGGSDIDAVDIDFGSALVEPTVPTMEGYTFGGWYFDNETFANVVDFSNDIMGASNVTIFAKWNINQYRLSYDTNGGSDIDAIDIDFGSALVEPTAPTKDSSDGNDYQFDGWYFDNETFENVVDFDNDIMGASNITIFAKWESYTAGLMYAPIDGGYEVSVGSANKVPNIVIPMYFEGEKVVSIAEFGFQSCSDLKTIYIPDSVTSICEGAFDGCISLESVNIPNGVTSIKGYVFYYCSSLETVNIPDGVTSIADYAFYGCTNLEVINIPDSVTSIGENVFEECSSLETVNIPDSVTSIGAGTFWGCGSLKTVNIPGSVISIGDFAFYSCSSLKTINIPDGVTSIGYYVFSGCSSLTVIDIPYGVTSIGRYAFEKCSSLETVNIPGSVTSIGDFAFYSCSSLETINIPDGVTSIGYYVFSGCSSLTVIDIPYGVTSIGGYAFEKCSSLETIYIPSSVTSIGMFAFQGCSGLTIYVEVTDRPSGWDSNWNQDNRPVVWGVELDESKTFVVSFTKSAENPINADAENGMNNPYRQGYTFAGWYDNADFGGARYDSIVDAPNGKLYAEWEEE